MNCQQVQHHLDSWVRGELDGATGQIVASHLAACSSCKNEADLARHLATGLRALRTPAPAALVDRILHSAAVGAAPRRVAWFTPLRALAAVLLVGVVIVFSRDRGELMLPMNPSVVASPQPLLERSSSPAEVPASVDASAAGTANEPVTRGAAEGSRSTERTATAAGHEGRTAVASSPANVAAPAAARAAAPAPRRATTAVTPAVVRSAVVAPMPAPAPTAVEGTHEAPKLFANGEASATSASAPVGARSAGLLTAGSGSAAPGGGSIELGSTGGVSGYTATASAPSREPLARSSGTKLFLRPLSADDAVGVTSFTQGHQLRSLSRNAFSDTTAASITTPYLKR